MSRICGQILFLDVFGALFGGARNKTQIIEEWAFL